MAQKAAAKRPLKTVGAMTQPAPPVKPQDDILGTAQLTDKQRAEVLAVFDVLTAKSKVTDAYKRYVKQKAIRDRAEELYRDAEAELIQAVPEGETVDKVFHKAWEQSNLKANDYIKELIATFVPQSDRAAAEAMRERFASTSPRHRFDLDG